MKIVLEWRCLEMIAVIVFIKLIDSTQQDSTWLNFCLRVVCFCSSRDDSAKGKLLEKLLIALVATILTGFIDNRFYKDANVPLEIVE